MLVTGHKGFIGQALAKDPRFEGGKGFDLKEGMDIRDPFAIADVIKTYHINTVVHLAALSGVKQCISDPIAACGTNVQGSVNVLEALKRNGGGRILLASSGAVQSSENPYAASKRAMEDFGRSYRELYDLEVVSLRFTNIYGPGSKDKTSCIAQFCKQALTNKEIIIYGDGEQTRDFVYIGDVVDAIWDQATTSRPLSELVVGTNRQISLNTLAQTIAEKTSAEIVHREARIGDVRSNEIPPGAIRFQTLTDIDEGIEKTLEYFRNELA